MEEKHITSHELDEASYLNFNSTGPSTIEIYKEIDNNSNIFTSNVRGKETTFLGTEYGNSLFMIEDFVIRIEKGDEAFSNDLDKYGHMKRLVLAKYFGLINAFVALHSDSKIYSPRVELFFSVFVAKYGLTTGAIGRNPDRYNPVLKMKEGEFFNQLISEINTMASQRHFKRKLYARIKAIARGHSSGTAYLSALFERTARLLVLRIDFGFRTDDPFKPHAMDLHNAQEHLARFFNNKRGKKLYQNLKGYIWRLECGREKGYHFHLIFFFDGSKVIKDEHLANEIGADWIKVTNGSGIYHNCNAHKQKYKRLGIGMISHDDSVLRANLLVVLAYMYKEDQTLREKHSGKAHGWGRGSMPKPRSNLSGRPRHRGKLS